MRAPSVSWLRTLADFPSVDDDEKLRDKVNDALNVYNEYLKQAPRQPGEMNSSETAQPDEPTNHEGGEAAQAES